MVKSRLAVSALSLSAVLLLTTPIIAYSKEKLVIALKPTTGWTVTMIDGVSPNEGYCALAQKYEQGLVLTLGQSARDEYSLAIDFQGQKLNTEKAYKITLQPGPGEIRAYEMMPASSQAMVVRLGYDNDFINSLQKSNQLKLSIDGKNYQFNANDMSKGKVKLDKCIAGLKGDGVIKTASNFSAEKIENSEFVADNINAEPVKKIKKEIVKIAPKKIDANPVKKALSIPAPERLSTIKKKVEPELKAVVTPAPIVEPVKKEAVKLLEAKPEVKVKKTIKISRVDSKTVKPKPVMLATPAPKVEAVSVAKKVEEKEPELKAVVTPAPIIEPAKKEEVKVAEAKPEVKKQDKEVQVSLAPISDRKISARPKSIAAEGKKYGSAVSVVERKAIDKAVNVEPVKVKEVKQAVEPEVKKQRVKEVKKEKPKAVEVKLADNEVLDEKKFPKPFSRPVEKKTQNKPSVQKGAVKNPVAAKLPRPPAVSPEKAMAELKAKQELEAVRKELRDLEKENHQLYQEAKKARGEVDTAVAKTSNQALKKMESYEKKLEAARADNLALSREIEELRRTQEDTHINALSGDSAAQQSMRRYNEAEREIKRLGLLLEQQRLAHRQEKTELEGMLFDPAVTEEAQRRKLADLEQRLADAEKRLKMESKKENKQDIIVQNKLRMLEGKLAEANKREALLAAEKERVKADARKIAEAKVKAAALAQKEQALKAKEQKLLLEAKKLSSAEATLAQARIKEQEIKVAEAKIREEAQRVSQAEIKLEQAKRKEQQVLAEEQKLRAKAQRLASSEAAMVEAKAKLAEANRKQAQIAAEEKRLNAQRKKIADYSRERITPKINNKKPIDAAKTLARRTPHKVPIPAFGARNIQGVLNQSGLSSVSNVVQNGSGRYSWHAAGMQGKAEVVLNSNRQSLSKFAQRYIAREKQKCHGDFASLPSTVPSGKQGYELACVGSNGGKSSSIVFAQKGRDLIAIAHETTADNMDAAIDARDKIASKL